MLDSAMKRRRLINAIAVTLLAVPVLTSAQQAAKVPRIGFLAFNTAEIGRPTIMAFRRGLVERGWVDGQNILVEVRLADGKAHRLPGLAVELVDLKVDLIVAASSASTRAAMDATKTIPIVMAASANAVGEGFISSLARPGGNVTGMTFLGGPEIAGKQLELLKEIAPAGSRIAVLANPNNLSHADFLREITTAARMLGVQIQNLDANSPDQLQQAFAAIPRDRNSAVLVLTDSMFLGQRQQIVNLAAGRKLPALYSQREFVDDGGLLAYGPNLVEMFRRSAFHVDKILKGAAPGTMAVEQPTKFELVINLKTAKGLGLAIPRPLLLRADEVIE
jgi:putative ABC transport system substrate-binding protein